jgi:hypothetical protein
LKKQKPIARASSAWCPGGRVAEKAARAPAKTASTAVTAPPAARAAAPKVPEVANVSPSTAPPPAADRRSTKRHVLRGVHRFELLRRSRRRLSPRPAEVALPLERRFERHDALRALGMTRHGVRAMIAVTQPQGIVRHGGTVAPSWPPTPT